MSSPQFSVHERIARVKLMAFDVDGVLTDGGIYLGEEEELKRYNTQDGAGLSIARMAGFHIAIITGRQSASVARRMEELKIEEFHQGTNNRIEKLDALTVKHNLTPADVMYMGDDILDLPAMKYAGFAVAPSNAVVDVKPHAHYVTLAKGGDGAVREIIEVVLRTQEKWDDAVENFLQRKMRLEQ